MYEVSDNLDAIRENLAKQMRLREAAQLVLDDWRRRREETQSSWDRTEEGMRGNLAFYDNLIATLQAQFEIASQFELQQTLEFENAMKALDETIAQETAALARDREEPPRGAITETVEGMLLYAKDPVSISQLTDRLLNNGLKTNREDAAAAVRSTLKNLKKQKKVYAIRPGLYEHMDNQFHKVASA